jgi:methionyl-tRNA formyltransferase
MGRARTVFIGSGPFALPALARLVDTDPSDPGRVEVVTVISSPPRPAGRSGEPRPTPVAAEARARKLPLLTPASLRDEAALSAVRATAADLIVLADYGRLVPAAVLALPRHGALNLHPSLLPRHRGAAPVAAAILAGDTATGVTLMRMDEGLDTGPILAQRSLPLRGAEAAPELEARLAVLAADLLLESLPGWLDGSLAARWQPDEGATLTRPLRRLDGRLQPERPAIELERQVRAYQPWPGSYLERDGGRLIVWRASVEEGPLGDALGEGALGDLVPVGDSLGLVTSSGILRLDEVQPAGKRRMPGAAYRRGRRP